MPEITYLMNRDESGFFTEAKKYFEDRRDADSVVVDTPPGNPWTLGEVLADLRIRAKEGTVFPVINVVAHGIAFGAVQFPISAARSRDDGGIITLDMLRNAVKWAGSKNFPPVLGAPAVTSATKVCFYGCDVGRSAEFMALFGQLFGPDVTVYAPLRMAVFRNIGGTSAYRLARSWSTAYTKDVLKSDPVHSSTRTQVGTLLKARFPSADIQSAIAAAGTKAGPTFFHSGRMELTIDGGGTPATLDPPLDLTSAVLPAGTVDDTTVALTLTPSDFKKTGGTWTAWVATLGQVIEEPVSLENPAQYRKTVISNGTRAARAELVPLRDPLPVPPDATDPDPDEEDPLEDPMKFYGKYRGVVVSDQGDGRLKINVPAVTPDDLVADACLPPVPRSLLAWPAVGETVWVEFEGGEPERAIWNGTLAPVQDPLELELSAQTTLKLHATTIELNADAGVTTTAAMNTVNVPTSQFGGIVNAQTVITNTVVSSAYTPGAGNIW